jgi:protein FAM50
MPDFSDKFNLPSTGIHTVEGNLAGARAASLTKQRQEAQAAFQQKKEKIKQEAHRTSQSIDHKFDSNQEVSLEEKLFREKTVGLVSAQEFVEAQKEAAELARKRRQGLISDVDRTDGNQNLTPEEQALEEKRRKKEVKKRKLEAKKRLNTLSFADADDADDILIDLKVKTTKGSALNNDINTKKEIKKDPKVDTSFLPDKEREEYLKAERQRLKEEWIQQQNRVKEEPIEITYSYWDGSGHRRTITCKKGDTIGQFLELVRKELSKDFREISNVSSDGLVYVKEDLIIPQDITFYDLIVTKARGKSGPLFNFDVHEDVRVGALDSRVEKDESHPGKVCERKWYERNKHIFPASRWEIFDPAKNYGGYTISGGIVHTKKNK